MWQHHYLIHAMRMDELRAEADRERRWRLDDEENGRPAPASAPERLRVAAARSVAALGRLADRLARRSMDRLVRDRAW